MLLTKLAPVKNELLKTIVVTTILVLQLMCAKAQVASMSGRVVYNDGQPAVNAVMQLTELGKYFVTNANGEYYIDKVPFGQHTIVINSIEATNEAYNLTVDNKTIQFDIVAKRAEMKLTEVVVNGFAQNNEIKTNGYAVNVINTKGIEMQSIQANELLDRSAGIRIRQAGGMGSRIEYNINGLSGNSIRMFINGLPIAGYGQSFSLNSIPSSMIERIEIYKGVVPAHLSDDALGGAINVVLKKNTGNSLFASYSYGSFNTHQSTISGGFQNDSNGFTARGALFQNYSDNSYKVWGDKVYITQSNGKIKPITAKRFHDRYRSAGGSFDVGYANVPWADRMMVGLIMSGMDKQAQHGATMETVYGQRFSEQQTIQGNMIYQKNDLFTKGLDFSITATLSHLNRQLTDTSAYIYNWLGKRSDFNNDGIYDKWASGAEGSSPTLEQSIENIFTTRLNGAYLLNKNLTLSVNFLHTQFNRKPDDIKRAKAERELMDTRSMAKQIGGITLENRTLNNKLKTSLFFKFYQQTLQTKDPVKKQGVLTVLNVERQNNKTGYGLATSYTLLPKWIVQLSAEKAVRLPEHSEVFGNSAENIDPSHNLKAEQSNNANVGWLIGPFEYNQHQISINSNLFYRQTKDMIRQAVASQQSETYAFENHDVVVSSGIDAEITYSYKHQLQITVSASNFNARFNKKYDAYGSRYIYYGDRLRNEPFLTGNGNVQYHWRNVFQKESKLTTYYNWGYVHQFYRDWPSLGGANKAIIPTQSIHDLGCAYTFPGYKFTLSADAKNITNRQVFDNWALQKPGRAFYIKLNYKLY